MTTLFISNVILTSMPQRYKTVGLKPETYRELLALKKRGISFDSIVSQLVELADKDEIEYSVNQ